jgi:hypothetical protein
MPSLTDPSARQAIVARLSRLTPESHPQWGTLTAPRMLCHLGDQLRVGLGDLPTRRMDTWASRSLVKWLVVRTPMRPPPGKVETAPEMLTSAPTTWEADMAHLLGLMERLATESTSAIHPFFGPLTHEEWNRLAWKHLDHHLRQFAC